MNYSMVSPLLEKQYLGRTSLTPSLLIFDNFTISETRLDKKLICIRWCHLSLGTAKSMKEMCCFLELQKYKIMVNYIKSGICPTEHIFLPATTSYRIMPLQEKLLISWSFKLSYFCWPHRIPGNPRNTDFHLSRKRKLKAIFGRNKNVDQSERKNRVSLGGFWGCRVFWFVFFFLKVYVYMNYIILMDKYKIPRKPYRLERIWNINQTRKVS